MRRRRHGCVWTSGEWTCRALWWKVLMCDRLRAVFGCRCAQRSWEGVNCLGRVVDAWWPSAVHASFTKLAPLQPACCFHRVNLAGRSSCTYWRRDRGCDLLEICTGEPVDERPIPLGEHASPATMTVVGAADCISAEPFHSRNFQPCQDLGPPCAPDFGHLEACSFLLLGSKAFPPWPCLVLTVSVLRIIQNKFMWTFNEFPSP